MGSYAKARKRERGTIDQLPSGALRVRVYAGVDPVSKREHYLTETVPAGPHAETEAEKLRTRFLNEINERRNPRTKATLNQLLEEYLSISNVDPGTLRGYRRNYENHVKPLLGVTKVGAIDPHVLDSFYAELRRCRVHCDGGRRVDHRTHKPHDCDDRCRPHECRALAPATIRRIHFLLSGALKRAVRWGWITSNPASTAEPPAEPKPDPQPPTPEEAARILNAAWEDPDWGTFVWLAMNTGARRAELCALRWRHIDLSSATITVRKSIDQSEGHTNEKDTKTHQHRRIAVDPETVAVLADHQVRCEERASGLGVTLDGDSFVFSLDPDGSTPPKPDTVTQRYGRLAQRLGIATTIHKLRHFSATELIAAGVDPRTVSGRLGHAGGGSTTLRVYSAWVAESDQRAATSLSGRLPTPQPAPDRTERAKSAPETPHERIAAAIRQDILDGVLVPGSPAPTQKEVSATHDVSAGTANRVMDLLKAWKVVEASRGNRAIVCHTPEDESAPDTGSDVVAQQEIGDDGPQFLELNLVCLGETVRTFNVEADPNDPRQLNKLLRGAVRRYNGEDADPLDYELEVKLSGAGSVLKTFAAL